MEIIIGIAAVLYILAWFIQSERAVTFVAVMAASYWVLPKEIAPAVGLALCLVINRLVWGRKAYGVS